MSEHNDFTPDHQRTERLGFDEAIYCLAKSAGQIEAIVRHAHDRGARLLLTRLEATKHAALGADLHPHLDYDPISATAWLGATPPTSGAGRVGIVTAGTSDTPIAREAARTLQYYGVEPTLVNDVGVAGLWRLMERVETLRELSVVIAVAGMDAALPSVIGGLLPGAVIAVPTSTGYGVAAGGHSALHAALASCSPGVTVVNIDNGYGAACAALRILGARDLP
ncbi:MAG: nickel pincer cofactor biosynthesis protein LarB [Ectothiorhodospiraceae bacterium]|nr:nickel pincer cofactor biosynthesis protein LarB [Chromatiales bacterium]MCP5156358.1 nickel pincer cofactor biosynthesis protein LarB [Ectothiorhodospiraceae bacterium]